MKEVYWCPKREREVMKDAVYWCSTEEDAEQLFKYLYSKGVRWSSGDDLYRYGSHWTIYGKETCYFIENGYLTYGDREYCYLNNINFSRWEAKVTIRQLLSKRNHINI